jgi:glyoxylase-like metal-dependent hydrolase (beta-lactamase superfamily II)/rhodanese-related sulfurtransferase
VDLDVVVTTGLGDNSYVLASGGEALVVDPQRDVDRYFAAAEAMGARIRRVLETHVHNDYLSGAQELRAAAGAEIVGPSGAGYGFAYHPVSEGDELALGGLRIVAIATPGHTPEHVAYLVYGPGDDAPTAVFTGGSLMVGGAGRTDLVGDDRTEELTRAQYRTLRRLASLPDPVRVLPTHGAGSFCGVAGPSGQERVSTIAEERAQNAALAAPDEPAFVRDQLSGLQAYPAYYRHMAAANRAGPPVRGHVPEAAALNPEAFAARMDAGAWPVDARWRVQFARAHVPGSVNVELDDSFATYVGWVVPFDAPIVLVLTEPEADASEAMVQLFRIGYDQVQGYLAGGVDAWLTSGRPVDSYRVAGLDELCRRYRSASPPNILDVRQDTEWSDGHIPESTHVFVGDLPHHLEDVPPQGEVWTICRSGRRAAIAASLLDRNGIPTRLVDGTGVVDFLKSCPPRAGEPEGRASPSQAT